jgi:phage gpG-like protein
MGFFDWLTSRRPVARTPVITIEGDLQGQTLRAAADLRDMADALKSFKDPLSEVVDKVMIPSIRRNFEEEGRPKWKGLAAMTIYKRSNKKVISSGSTHPILQDTKALLIAATSKRIWTITDSDATVTGLNDIVPYANFNQGGTEKMPARPFIVFQEEDIEAAAVIFDAWMEEIAIKKGRFRLG